MKKTCAICGKKAVLNSSANYDIGQLGGFGFASRKIPEYMHYELWECKDCGYLMAENTLDISELSARYQAAQFDSGQEAGMAGRTYMHYLKKYCPGFSKEKVMDIGTGEGSYLKYLLHEGTSEIIGVEPSRAPIEAADKRVRKYIVNDIFKSSDYEEGTFDMISCFQTIEHIPEPRQLLRGINGLLKEGGIAYLVCHDYRSFVNKILGMKSPVYDIEHLQLFSKKSIYKLMKQEGFENIKVFTLVNRYPLKYWTRLFPIPYGIKKPLLEKMEKSGIGQIKIGMNVGNIGVIAYKQKDTAGHQPAYGKGGHAVWKN